MKDVRAREGKDSHNRISFAQTTSADAKRAQEVICIEEQMNMGSYASPPFRVGPVNREDKVLVRIISPIGEEFHYRLSPRCTISELKRQFQQLKPQLKADKLFFFHDLKNVENDTAIEDLDHEWEPQLDAMGQITTSYKVKPPSSIALLYAFDYLGRWSNKSARQREFYDEIMATHLLRFDAKGFEANLILDKLYLGNINAAFNLKELKAMGITHIITAHNSLKPLYPKHFSYLTVQAEDLYYVNLIDHFEATAKFIDEGRKQGGVLVHWYVLYINKKYRLILTVLPASAAAPPS